MGGPDYWGFAFPPSLAPLFSSAGLFCLSKFTRDWRQKRQFVLPITSYFGFIG
jgi:hypothetical protein